MTTGEMTKLPLFLVVAAALVDRGGKVFVQQRPIAKQHGGLWEFPGGKVEPGEAPEAALARELHEELGIAVSTSALQPLSFATVSSDDRNLVLLLYCVHEWTGTPCAIAAASARWVAIEALRELDMPPADLPLVDALAQGRAAGASQVVIRGGC
ncbi:MULTISPECIES: (deoxy)nucleoside triphosphate pyrophosphohydrolase [unclassified Sphingomonas]|uniref:(deoxy)nucleoside triphosphate pyrophosphohydrolase n=1 Tax=unclassified Sphingomonas TaxID=196159 RepID=UPI001D11F40B|nr:MULTISPECIES: (deoxy)nucleoside triphosphate pyrophosphohydrolase [unclassified Sphingomonas]MCC2980129.1 (deoxy)nucleoside triphosphate pyrophosphohydrolase [Sphingomonas sp. IC4-52]MCD2314880.1 (deoxy)nucleoside triphosphate pyrophosphohydrolase [Sphingomonas sp. IC-11]